MKRLISIAIAILAVCLGLAVWSEGLQKSQGDTGENTLNLSTGAITSIRR
ncbi:spermidine/putrescine-binding periplasmic protein [Lacticaseibacillus paracasei subsp. paracasei Lpp126]|uniref:Spermidine/putrescine-binding periplasmic protein n=1 Tax=Lacticaseibacillus paracasei subsp. paracasei Lpp126 TaxID=1256206 RepID=S2R9Q9_LACPA|nr:spermidine/putrescine-binding periplasmic protein [Lacticaseibacillus paracasei subsp. paracasei Lpp126]